MPKKASVPLKIAPLQGVVAEPITDPAEQAAIDKMRKRARPKQGGRKGKAKGDEPGGASTSATKRRG